MAALTTNAMRQRPTPSIAWTSPAEATRVCSVTRSTVRRESIDGRRLERLAGSQHDRRKSRMIDRVWEVLRFERETGVSLVFHATHAGKRSVEPVASEELNAGFRCPDL